MACRWTEEEENNIAKGIKINTRTLDAIRLKKVRLGIYCVSERSWTAEEIEELKKGNIPNNRTVRAAYSKSARLNLNKNIIDIFRNKRNKERVLKRKQSLSIRNNVNKLIQRIDKNLILKKLGWN